MAVTDFARVADLNVLMRNQYQRNLIDGETLAFEIQFGPWGPGARYCYLTIDTTTDPNTYQYVQQAYDPLIHTIINLTHNAATVILGQQPVIATGVDRHGPINSGAKYGENRTHLFTPVTLLELTPAARDVLTERGNATAEITLLREIVNALFAIRGAAPALIDVPARVQVCIPMANIKATIGKLPTNPKDIALWLNERTHCLDGVYPTPTANQKLALVNSLLPAGLSITLAEARDWDSVISNVYEKTHGKVTISSLADTLGQVNKTSGIVAAYILGLRFTQGNHEIVWGCLKALIKGQGLLLDLERQIQGVPVEQKPIMVPEILKNTYTLVGRSLTGDPIGLTKPQTSDRKPERSNAEKRGNFLVQERKWRPPFTQYQTPVYPRDEQWDRRAHTPRNPAAWTPQIGHSVQERVAKVKPLRPKWKKPTTILKKINERTFIIQDTKGKERKVSIDNLKPTAHCSNVTVQDGGDTVSATDFDRAAASRSTDCKTTECGK
ncbi:uncharacterized protein LOC142501134 isoform X2 [Ascaphus truei]|uniref:uncharacterized protein LOC142501134 isoform X2 n=1 Tax=Ascaphus truei TaxID=8439 RepID=UPI003F5A7D22